MKPYALAFAAGLFALTGSPGLAMAAHRAPPIQAASDAVRLQLGTELGRLMNSEEVTRAQSEKLFEETLPKSLAANPDFQALEAKYPGISKAAIDAMQPVLMRQVMTALPELWRRLGTFYAANMTESELHGAVDFFSSPTGSKVIKLIAMGMDLSAAVSDVMKGGEITDRALVAGLRGSAAGLAAALSAAEERECARFLATPSGKKLIAISRQARAVAVQWSNESSPEQDAEIERVMTEVMERFIGKKLQ